MSATTAIERTAWIIDRLTPFAEAQGMRYLSAQRQFRRPTATGFAALIVSLSHYAADSVLELHLAIRNDLIENTAFRYTNGLTAFAPNSLTLVASTAKLRGLPIDRYTIGTEADAEAAMEALLPWLKQAIPAFWAQYASVQAIDKALNVAPTKPTALMPNQQLRCLRGLVAARYAQRTDWVNLVPIYRGLLDQYYATPPIVHGFGRLVDFLRTYVPN